MLDTLPQGINSSTIAMLEAFLANALDCGVSIKKVAGASVFQFSGEQEASLEAGIVLAKVCLGGDGEISVVDPQADQISLPHISVKIDNPLLACIGCQYAGWSLRVDDYSAMASGPLRMLRGSEEVLEKYGLMQTDVKAIVVLESSKLPSEKAVRHIAEQANVISENLFVCVARTSSLPGSLQVVARSVETAMHKLHEIGFDLTKIRSAHGTAPLPPKTDSDLIAMGWTNDAILYGANVELTVDASDCEIEVLIDQVPSNSCNQFGQPFLWIFEAADKDFYQIDPLLFAPARITIVNESTKKTFSAGQFRTDILKTSFEL